MLPSPRGRRAPAWLPAWNKLLPSPVGRRAPAWLPAWDELLTSLEGRWVPAWVRLLPSPGGRWAIAWEEMLPSPEGRRVPACLPAWDRLLPSLGGRKVLASLPACEAKLEELVGVIALALVIFPSLLFLFSRMLYLFNCLCLTLENLISPTLSMKPWHSLRVCAEIIDASCHLHSSVCLAMLSRILFMDFILAWSKSFSAFLIILLAFSVFKVDLSLILTGINSLWRHLRLNILWFL